MQSCVLKTMLCAELLYILLLFLPTWLSISRLALLVAPSALVTLKKIREDGLL
jgi:hypothetical protein